jgi:beta-glucanase (GH16 family)
MASRFSPTVVVAIAALLAACSGSGGNGRPGELPPAAPVPTNVNIGDPKLLRTDNAPVTAGGNLALAWSDEFDGDRLDPATWFFESGDGSQYSNPGWGNNELQWYLPDSATVRDGRLVITVRRRAQNGYEYTSARLHTRDRFAFRYGRIEARMKLPGGQGIWPAFWLMPQDQVYGGWAASGEIDVMEAINLGGAGGNEVHGTLHYGAEWPNNVYSGNAYAVPGSVTAGYHDYALEWGPGEIRWYVDGAPYAAQDSWSTAAAAFPAPFDQYFYVIFNVAVGGNWPGAPDASTAFPVTMEVDYVRVYSGAP